MDHLQTLLQGSACMHCFVLATFPCKKKVKIHRQGKCHHRWMAGGWTTTKKCASLPCPVLSTESKLMQLQEVPVGPRASSLVRLEARCVYRHLFSSAMFSASFLYPRKPKLVGLVHQHEPLRAAPAVQSQLWC